MKAASARTWLIRWLYAAAAAHFFAGLALPWIMQAPILESYHRGIEAAFWHGAVPTVYAAPVRAQRLWWQALFCATLQNLALYMAALIRLGQIQRSPFAWGALTIGILIWAPQDIAISLQADCWPHVAIDILALAALVPPLCWLWRRDFLATQVHPR
jgi:hypothetical protein